MAAANIKYPDRRALYFEGTVITGRELTEKVDSWAIRFLKMGVRPGHIVTIALPNCPQAVYSIYALNKIGAVSSIVHSAAAAEELFEKIKLTESRLIITLPEIAARIGKHIEGMGITPRFLITELNDEIPSAKGNRRSETTKLESMFPDCDIIRWSGRIRDSQPKGSDKNIFPYPMSDDTAVIIYSGGTTGESKGIEITNGNLNHIGKSVIACTPMLRPEMNDTFAVCLPIFHGFGLGVGIHCSLYNGLGCTLIPSFSAKTFARTIQESKSNIFIGVPSMYEKIIAMPSMEKIDWANIKGIFCGGEKLSSQLEDKIDEYLEKRHAKVRICEGYGLAENLSVATISPVNCKRKGSVGIPIANTYIRIISPETQEELPYGQEGEICISGPGIMKGYFKNASATAKCIYKDKDLRKWLRTGDAGYMDDDGFLYISARMSRMIIINGYNLYPHVIENLINTYPAAEKTYVTDANGIDNLHYIKAYVVLKTGIQPCEELQSKIIKYCREKTTLYSIPMEIEFVSGFPTTELGKISIRRLSEISRNSGQIFSSSHG